MRIQIVYRPIQNPDCDILLSSNLFLYPSVATFTVLQIAFVIQNLIRTKEAKETGSFVTQSPRNVHSSSEGSNYN
jgi:hypothetical protein